MTTKTLKALSEMWARGIPPKEMRRSAVTVHPSFCIIRLIW